MIEELEYKGHTIVVYPDEDAEDPRSWSEILIAVKSGNPYIRGDIDISKYETLDDFVYERECLGDIVFPLYMYAHGGVALGTTPFLCPWDSGLAGAVVVPHEIVNGLTDLHDAKPIVDGFLKTLQAYINGECCWYETLKNGETVDSCGGFYSIEDALQSAKENVA